MQPKQLQLEKKQLLAPCSAALGLALCMAQPASALPITDTYIGGNDHGYGDVIGDTDNFQIYGMDVLLSGSILSVSINTTFAGKGDNGLPVAAKALAMATCSWQAPGIRMVTPPTVTSTIMPALAPNGPTATRWTTAG